MDSLIQNDSIPTWALEIMTNGMQANYLVENDFIMLGDVALAFEMEHSEAAITVSRQGNQLLLKSTLPMRSISMAELRKEDQSTGVSDSMYTDIPTDTLVPFSTGTLYMVAGQQFVFREIKKHAAMVRLPSGRDNKGTDCLRVKVQDGDFAQIVELNGGMGAIPERVSFLMNGVSYQLEYGSIKLQLPFSIRCNDFQLDRYPGSNQPSSFASEVTILDEELKVTKDKRIFMNNVIDYRGYRFFQSGYDPDEGGTRLSVNHDAPGTFLSYLGYLLMGIGMILSFIAPGGRFRELYRKLAASGNNAVIVLMLLFSGFAFSQHDGHNHDTPQAGEQQKPVYRVMSEEHSNELASLLVLDIHGRVIPYHTLCDQILRKIHRGNTFDNLNAVQVITSMHMYQGHWVREPILYVSSKSNLREKLKMKGDYISYVDLTNMETGEFLLAEDYTAAFQKFESQRNEYDKRLIQLGEHYQVMTMVLGWEYMRLVPIASDPNKNWYSPLSTELPALDSNAFRLAYSYLASLDKASEDGRYGTASDLLKDFKTYQRKIGKDIVPEESKVEREISYNKQSIFKKVQYIYLTIGAMLLILFFIKVLSNGAFMERPVKIASMIFTVIAACGFIYHAYGIYLRWDISGHAPWSDGYEALVFIASIATLTGLALTRIHPVILAGSLILAFLMLFVAEMNLMDPEITPLQPVLKSYWLMIHVAIITGSYGPLGIVCMLAIINLILYIVRTKKNGKYITRTINELTWISEMILMIGVVMLTIGTFLGGVWANESWGRYWGWDPKETWALVAILAYAIILHFRFIPKLKSKFVFNTASMWGFTTILFTFFGVNFYLVGLHSYAQGEGLGKFPTGIWVAVFIFLAFNILAWWRNKQYIKSANDE